MPTHGFWPALRPQFWAVLGLLNLDCSTGPFCSPVASFCLACASILFIAGPGSVSAAAAPGLSHTHKLIAVWSGDVGRRHHRRRFPMSLDLGGSPLPSSCSLVADRPPTRQPKWHPALCGAARMVRAAGGFQAVPGGGWCRGFLGTALESSSWQMREPFRPFRR